MWRTSGSLGVASFVALLTLGLASWQEAEYAVIEYPDKTALELSREVSEFTSVLAAIGTVVPLTIAAGFGAKHKLDGLRMEIVREQERQREWESELLMQQQEFFSRRNKRNYARKNWTNR